MISKTMTVTTTPRLILTRLDRVRDGSGGRMATGKLLDRRPARGCAAGRAVPDRGRCGAQNPSAQRTETYPGSCARVPNGAPTPTTELSALRNAPTSQSADNLLSRAQREVTANGDH